MDTELATLVGSGATTLVRLMVSDSWEQVKRRVAALFARAGGGVEAVESELEASRRLLTAVAPDGEETVTPDMEAAWRVRLRQLLRADPAVVSELRQLLLELDAMDTDPSSGAVHNTVRGDVRRSVVMLGRDFGDVTLGPPPSTGERQRDGS